MCNQVGGGCSCFTKTYDPIGNTVKPDVDFLCFSSHFWSDSIAASRTLSCVCTLRCRFGSSVLTPEHFCPPGEGVNYDENIPLYRGRDPHSQNSTHRKLREWMLKYEPHWFSHQSHLFFDNRGSYVCTNVRAVSYFSTLGLDCTVEWEYGRHRCDHQLHCGTFEYEVFVHLWPVW